MKLDAILAAHGFMRVERPAEIWSVDTEDTRFIPLLGEMIAAHLSRGAALNDLTLNVSNVVVEPEDDPDVRAQRPLPGEYVAVSVSGPAELGPDRRWPASGAKEAPGLLDFLARRLVVAGVSYAYVRRLSPGGSITVFLRRE